MEGLELFGNMRAVRDGRYVVIDLPTVTALRSPTVLSIPWRWSGSARRWTGSPPDSVGHSDEMFPTILEAGRRNATS